MKLLNYILIFSLFIVTACNKWKKPTDTMFYMEINKTPTVNNQLTFSGGHFIMSKFEFDGRREKGDDVFFSQDFPNGLTIPFDLGNEITELDFQIPQGSYHRIEIDMRTSSSGVGILVEGTYTYNGGGSIPVRFEFDAVEQFEIEAENDGGGNIILDKDHDSPAKIILDPTHWFSPVPLNWFENATVTNLNGTNTILIDKDINEDIYDVVLDRLEETAAVIFNY